MSNKDKKISEFSELGKSIEQAKKRLLDKERVGKNKPAGPGRISIELLSGVVVGTLLGYYLDLWLGTSPVFFLICFFLGVAGSGLNIYKIARQQDKNVDLDE